MDRLSRLPLHPIFFTTYPILALLATNIVEVEIQIAVRPLLISLAGTVIVLLVVRLILKDWRKAALVTTLLLILFFSYGHLYQFIRKTPIFGVNVGRHRYLIVAYSALLLIGLWWILGKLKDIPMATQLLNVVGLVLLIYPSFQIFNFFSQASTGERVSADLASISNPLIVPESGDIPDIYYIILDTYTRADALLNDFGFDNSPFLDELSAMGFFVADCSRCNYIFTQGSLTSALNLEYLPELQRTLADRSLGANDIWVLMKNSLVRKQLEAIGYKTVAFDTGYEWSRISDADIYLGLASNPFGLQILQPFEAMLIKSTAGLILTDTQNKLLAARFKEINFPYSGFANRQLFILDQLLKIPSISGPKFVFVHILIPHVPRVFGPQGEILTDTGFYGGEKAEAINDDYFRRGYVGEIIFLNNRMLDIVGTILAQSTTPPIIIIQGDTGCKGNNFLIINAYYLPGEGSAKLYSTITPVNTFRVIFDTYFGTSYSLLPDESFHSDDLKNSVPETSPACISE